MDFRSITLKDTVVYSVTCVREFDQKCVMKDDVRAWNAIGIDDFAKYWIGSFGDQALEKSKSEKGSDCSIIITCSNGDSKVFSTLGKNKFNPDEKKAKSIVTVEVDCEEKKTESAYKDTPIPEKVEVAAEKTIVDKASEPIVEDAAAKKSEPAPEEKKSEKPKAKKPKADSEPKEKKQTKKSAAKKADK